MFSEKGIKEILQGTVSDTSQVFFEILVLRSFSNWP